MVLTKDVGHRFSDRKRARIGLCASVGLASVAPLALCATMAMAQDVTRNTSVRELPRKGYEPRDIRLGATVIRLQADASAAYDSNVFATSTDERDDIVFQLRPRIEAENDSGVGRARFQAYANLRELVDNSREGSLAFGASLNGDRAINQANSISATAQYDRAIESRADPERRAGILDPPRKIDVLFSDFRFAHRGARFGIDVTGALQRFDYLSPIDADRDLNIYRGSITGSIRLASALDLFAEAYVNRRDFDRTVDFSGVDRDATTYGLLVGGRRELTGRLRGRLGVGVFRSEPSDPSLKPFSGFSASGDLTWTPRPRTIVTLSAFSGDVATVRSGASGRTDTRLGVRVEQEARHNILLRGGVSYLRTRFRGVGGQRQASYAADVEAEYLLNRHVSAFGNVAYVKRTAQRVVDRFDRSVFMLGVRLRY